ncbi:uncharacterized protein LOC100374311 [Saccoglossus kowalevskii]|uniref:Uncharacterized protein LOC100374311 n=1 Tax=Saccoglossus kowalevskii TaxID=10224 RepID=A0ABM0M414_SACKO|nr:PREDICTED: uncharacterized protein LOC100374311 [Saccoglossus kowalevskii]
MYTKPSLKFAALVVVVVTTGDAASVSGSSRYDDDDIGWSNFIEWPEEMTAEKSGVVRSLNVDEGRIPLLVQPKYQRVEELIDPEMYIKHGPKKIVGGNNELKEMGLWQPEKQQPDADYSGDYDQTHQQPSSEFDPSDKDEDQLRKVSDIQFGNYLKKSPEHPPQYPGGLLWSYKTKKGFAAPRR